MTDPTEGSAHHAEDPAYRTDGPAYQADHRAHLAEDPPDQADVPFPPAQPSPDRADGPAYRIEDLAHLSGATVRTIRAYQNRGLLPRPQRRGRANVYANAHLMRLRQIADLLDRGYTLASIKELLEAWDAGRGLGGVLGLVAEVDGPWTDEQAVRISRAELGERFGGTPDDVAVAEAVELGVLEPVPGDDEVFRVPSPQELAVAVELHAAGVPLSAISGHLRELRGQVEHIASRFLEFTTEHVFARYLDGPHRPTEADAAVAASLVRRLRPLAQQTVDAELARAICLFAVRHLRLHLGAEETPSPTDRTRSVAIPAETMRAVEELVGSERAAEFIALATEREVRARALDRLATTHEASVELEQTP
jgi:DNA-binding transcriptional MerR regulator